MCGDTEKNTEERKEEEKSLPSKQDETLYLSKVLCFNSNGLHEEFFESSSSFSFLCPFPTIFYSFPSRSHNDVVRFPPKKKKQKRNEMINIIAQDVAEMCKKLIRLS